MKKFSLAFLLSLVLSAGMAHGATHVVTPGQSLQAAINGAASGDVILIPSPWVYNEPITITGKSLRIIGLNPGQHQVQGDVAISALPAGGKVTMRNITVMGNLDANGSSLALLHCYVHGDLTAPAKLGPTGNEVQLTVVQSEVRENIVSKAARTWVGYSTLRFTYFENKVELVGNDFDGRANGKIGIDLNGTTTTAAIHNNRIHDYSLNNTGTITEQCIGIRVRGGATAEIRNNLIYGCKDSNGNGNEIDIGMGVFVKAGARANVIGNVIWDCFMCEGGLATRGDRLVYAPADSAVRHNVLWNNTTAPNNVHSALVGGGVANHDGINADPKFVGGDPYDYHLQADSPAKDKGQEFPQYNDRDGTRNDIGMYGGHNFIPDGRTTDKPIVIGLDVAPIAVPAGGTVTIESTGATVK